MTSPGFPRRIVLFDAFGDLAGSGYIMLRIARHLDRERFEPLGVLAREGPLRVALEDAGVPVTVLPPGGPLSVYGGRLMQSGPLRKLRAAMSLHRYSLTIERWLREHDADLLHCNQTRAVMIAGPGAKRARVPVVWNVLIRQQLPAAATMLAARCAGRIVTNAPGNLDDLPMADALRAKTSFVPNGIDTRRFSPEVDGSAVRAELGAAPGDQVILSAGVLSPRKGHELLVRATPRILERHPQARIVIAGGPPVDGDESHAGELVALAEGLGVGASVTLLGRREDMPELLAACDVFVLASHQEGSPAAVIEAMATARPVVVTPPAAAALAEEGLGLTVPLDDSEALAAAVIELLEDPSRAAAMGAAAREHVEVHHSVEVMVRGYEEVYSEMLSASSRS